MNLMERLPADFFKLFTSKYTEYYIRFLAAIYEEMSLSYSVLGLTERECKNVMNEKIATESLFWEEENMEEDGVFLNRGNMASVCLKHFEDWGWMKQDYDETLNCYVVTFPEYSQLFIELFQKMLSENESQERESVLTVYSHLYTYRSDKEKNNEILKSALRTSKKLVQMMVNMQDGMRTYFDELSRQKDFRGIQEVLVKEINNSDSKKYAILTTTDSFYRYKEAVKELLDQILEEKEHQRLELEGERIRLLAAEQEKKNEGRLEENSADSLLHSVNEQPLITAETLKLRRIEHLLDLAEEAMDMIQKIERQFDAIEKRYNRLIEQKTMFASRAVARIRYILQEGNEIEDQTVALIHLLNHSEKKEEILQKLSEVIRVSRQYSAITDKSMYRIRDRKQESFDPQAVEQDSDISGENLDDFILKPLYTKEELRAFRKLHEKDGRFQVEKDSIQSMEDLEKLFFLWQEATENAESDQEISLGEDLSTEEGYTISALSLRSKAFHEGQSKEKQ